MSGARHAGAIDREPESECEGLWPSDFAPLRQFLLVLFCVIGWWGILAVLAVGNNLLGLKKAILILAGAHMEPVLGAASLQSVDIAVVLAGFILVLGAGYIHVSLGLAVVLALRPWLDGFTYPTDNFYFLWAVLYLLGMWAYRQFRNPLAIRGKVPLALLAVYLGFCLLSAYNSIQFDATYRELLHWAAFATMFFLALNTTHHPSSRGVVLAGLFAGMAGQALFAYPHLWYVLPWIREYLQEDPRRLAQWFKGATEFTPELARRFNLNRAFASMVFPNALAALLILGIPASFACARNGITEIRQAIPANRKPVTAFTVLIPMGLSIFMLVCLPLYFLGQLPLAYSPGGASRFPTPQDVIYLSVGTAAVVTCLFLLGARKHGVVRAARGLGAIGTLILCPVLCGALWITYSRGAILSLLVASFIAATLHHCPRKFMLTRRGASLLLLALIGATVSFGLLAAHGEERPGNGDAVVTGEGMNVTIGELADPGSMKLRLSYWRVALSAALDHSGMGVGLGNFRIIYGPYQYLGAGDVQNAHNAVLQSWCEIGLPGTLALVGFWGYVLYVGACAIRGCAVPARRRMLAGLYGGVLAFLLHSLLDINFSHPSLVLYVMATTGLFFSYAAEDSRAGSNQARGVALAALLFAALVSGLACRPYLLDLTTNGGRFINVSNRSMNESRNNAALYFLAECTAWERGGRSGAPPALPITEAVALLPDRDMLLKVGRVLAPDPERKGMLPLAKDSAYPSDAVFQIERPWDAHLYAFTQVEAWTSELERLDGRFPCDPQIAYLLSNVYKLLLEQRSVHQEGRKEQLLEKMLAWANEAVRRSPMHKDMWQNLAWAQWSYGTQVGGTESLAHFQSALVAFERSQTLGHLDPGYYFAYADALGALGASYEKAGQAAEASAYRNQSQRIRSTGEDLQRARWSRGLQ